MSNPDYPNGDYIGKCDSCDRSFTGDKIHVKAKICFDCSCEQIPDLRAEIDSLKDLLKACGNEFHRLSELVGEYSVSPDAELWDMIIKITKEHKS